MDQALARFQETEELITVYDGSDSWLIARVMDYDESAVLLAVAKRGKENGIWAVSRQEIERIEARGTKEARAMKALLV